MLRDKINKKQLTIKAAKATGLLKSVGIFDNHTKTYDIVFKPFQPLDNDTALK